MNRIGSIRKISFITAPGKSNLLLDWHIERKFLCADKRIQQKDKMHGR